MSPEDDARYLVVKNDEEQYSIWEAGSEPPSGWHAEGMAGTRTECLEHVRKVWTDLRPRSLRQAMDAPSTLPDQGVEEAGPSLVDRLCQGPQPVEVRPLGSDLLECLERGLVHVFLTSTQGGTLLGLQLDRAQTSQDASGPVRLQGNLTLDGQPLRCRVEVDAASLRGTARFELP